MRRWLLFPLLTAFFTFCACALRPPLPPVPPAPLDLLSRMEVRSQALQGLKGLAQIKVSSPEKSFTTEEVLFVRRPTFLRAEILGPLGTPQFYLATDGRKLSLFNPTENRYYQGQATAKHLSFALPVTLGVEDAVAMLLGGLPLIPYDQASIRGDPQERLWILDLVSSSREERQLFWVDPRSFLIFRAEIQRPGASLQLTFFDFRSLQGVLFPRRIQLVSLESRAALSLEYREVEVNPEWGTMDFQLPVPPGATVLPLE